MGGEVGKNIPLLSPPKKPKLGRKTNNWKRKEQ
jgi:hypothetical protein